MADFGFFCDEQGIPVTAQPLSEADAAATRATGTDPLTGRPIAPQYAGTATSDNVNASIAASQHAADVALAQSQQQIDAAHAACGGFLADLMNPFSANVDPNSNQCKAANFLKDHYIWLLVGVFALVALGFIKDIEDL